jgi:hypothetical protein
MWKELTWNNAGTRWMWYVVILCDSNMAKHGQAVNLKFATQTLPKLHWGSSQCSRCTHDLTASYSRQNGTCNHQTESVGTWHSWHMTCVRCVKHGATWCTELPQFLFLLIFLNDLLWSVQKSVHIFWMWNDSPGTEPRDLKRCQRGITWQEYFSFWCDCKTCSSSCGQKLLGTVHNTNVFRCHWHHKTNGATHVNIALTCGRTVLVTSFFRSYLHTMTTILFRRQVILQNKSPCSSWSSWSRLLFVGQNELFGDLNAENCTSVVVAKGKGGCLDHLGSLLSAFFHQELRTTPEPFWTLAALAEPGAYLPNLSKLSPSFT